MRPLDSRLILPLLGLALLTVQASAAPSGTPGPGAVDHAPGVSSHSGLDGVYGRFADAYRDLDPAAVAALYTEDARYLAPGEEVLRGREAVESQFAAFFDAVRDAGARLEIRFEILERGISGDLAYEVGIYTLTTLLDGETIRTTRGKFVVVACEAEDGSWRFQVDGYSHLPDA